MLLNVVKIIFVAKCDGEMRFFLNEILKGKMFKLLEMDEMASTRDEISLKLSIILSKMWYLPHFLSIFPVSFGRER